MELKRAPSHVITIPAIGSKVFDDLRTLWAPKFDKNFEEFCKVNKIGSLNAS